MAIRYLSGINVDSNTLFVDDSNNRVGIGTASPSDILAINSSNTETILHLTNTSTGTTISDGLRMGLVGASAYFLLRENANMLFSTNNTERMRINNAGNVGIGETSIDARLHITTASAGLVNQKFESAGSAAWRLGIPASQTYFAFDNSADALTSPKMVITSAGNVGIGTTSPNHLLDVEAAGASARIYNLTSDGNTDFYLSTVGTIGSSRLLFGDTANNAIGKIIYRNNGDSMAFETNASEAMRITSAGSVGIGTTSPIVGLDVRGTAIITNQAGNDYNENLRLPQATSGYAALTLGGSIAASGTSAAQWTILKFPTNDNFAIRNNNSDLLYITTGGNVGIGTTSPVEKLMISNAGAEAIHFNPAYLGQSYIYSYNRSTGGYVDLILQSLNLIFQSNGGNERMRITSGGNVGIGTTSPSNQLHIVYASNNTSALIIQDNARRLQLGRDMIEARSSDGTSVQNLYIQPNGNVGISATSGNVGIGTTGPSYKLDVVANSNDGIRLAANNALIGGGATGGDAQLIYWNGSIAYYGRNSLGGSVSQHEFRTSGTTRLIVDASGNVGIGTTSPGYALDVVGDFRAQDNSNQLVFAEHGTQTVAELKIIADTAHDAALYFGDAVDNVRAGFYYDVSANQLQFRGYDNGNRMVISSNGNVGIGTTSPGTTLDIYGSLPSLRLDSTGHADLIIDRGSSAYDANLMFRTAGSTNFRLWMDAADALGIRDEANATEMVTFKSGGNVGIGTTSPAYKLDVNGTSNENLARFYRDSNSATSISHLVSTGRPQTRYSYDGYTSWYIGNNLGTFGIGSGYLASTAATLNITSAGNVGIGTTSPTYPLDVNGDGRITGMTFTASGAARRISTHSAAGLLQLNGGTSSSDGAFINIAGDSYGTGDYVEIYAAKTYVSGNVGIATTNPQALLQVGSVTTSVYSLATGNADIIAENKNLSDTQMGTLNVTSTTKTSSGTFNQGYGPSITFTQNGSGYVDGYEKVIGGIKTEIKNAQNLNFASIMQFYTHNNTSLSPRMTIDGSTGNVGIGTTSPAQKLEVSFAGSVYGARFTRNDAAGSSLIEFANNAGVKSIIGYDAGVDGYRIGTPTANNLTVKQSGNVGIGTTSPIYKLQVAGSTYINGGTLFIDSGNYLMWGNSAQGIKGVNDTSLEFVSGSSERMRITAAGNVGIGTTSPGYALDVVGDIRSSANTRVGTNLIVGGYADITGLVNHRTNIRVLNKAATNWLSWATRDTTGTEAVIDLNYIGDITASGNVGIGTASPAYKLDVIGTMRIAGNEDATNLRIAANLSTVSGTAYQNYNELLFENTGATYGNAGIRHLGNAWLDSKSALAFFTSSNTGSFDERMRIDASGNVGIGTTSPSAQLHVYSTGNSEIEVQRASGALFNIQAQSALAAIGTDSNHPLYLKTNAGTRVAITTSGNVGIGTTTPTTRLDLGAGNGAANGLSFGSSSTGVHRSSDGTTLDMGHWANVAVIIDTDNNDTSRHFSVMANSNDSTTATTLMRVLETGNVGIGTTSPSYKLDVNGSFKGGGFIADDSTFTLTFNSVNVLYGNLSYGALPAAATFGTGDSGIVSDFPGSEVMRITSAGNVGIGTTSPDSKFHVEDTNPEVRITGTGGTSFPRLLWEYPVSATQASRWALTGGASANIFYLYNYTQSKKIFQVDGTASHITLNHDAAGTTQIGTSTTQTAYQLYVATNVGQTGAIEAAGSVKITSGALGVNIAASATAGRIDASNDIVAYSTSDKRLKENIKPLENATEKVKKLTGVEFDWKQEHKAVHGYEGHDVGVIAQEVQEVLPEAIRTNDSGYLSVRYEKLIGLLIESNKELAARIEELEQKLKQ